MRVCIDLDENGVLIHNTLILIPLQSTMVILRKLQKGYIVSILFIIYHRVLCFLERIILGIYLNGKKWI